MTRHTARYLATCLLASALGLHGALADDKSDPVVAKVGTDLIHLSDVTTAAESLPAQARQMPRDQLLPKVLEQLVDTHVLALEARKMGIDKDPIVQRALREVQERALVSALLEREVGPHVTDAAVKERFDKDVGNQPPMQEVHARHILVEDEATAKKIIAELKKGGDFAALAKKYSTDPGGAAPGGDLGFFRKEEMVPEFATAAFAMKPGEISAVPVHTQFGWHVIKLEERRTAPPPSFEQSHDQLRQKMIQEGVQAVIAKARADVKIERFNMDGSVPKATDGAEQPQPAK